ncbi:hypothetical protein [Chitinophaga vietnamensis]|uniref:hypothetical protein n=1 Tax=Chitinophaga vietnamensis TaxID=2593957 RepID=UPI0011783933|nr:hypothetical protein [Chitinophaga vietnamensis]
MNYCHVIDWLQLHVKCPVSIEAKDNFKYHTEKLDLQTRHFKEVYEISVLMPSGIYERCATLACKPHASFLGGDMGLLKIENKFLYQPDLRRFVAELLEQYNFRFHAISRIDIAMDFISFKDGLSPEKFIRDFLGDIYLKKHKAKFSVSGEHQSCNTFEYLRFGSKTSELNYYLYNKSRELEANKNKPWIREMWAAAGFDEKETVWRLEFSLKSSCKELLDYDGGEVVPFNGLEVITPEMSFTLFKTLFHKHFSFVHNNQGNRKDRMEEVHLLELIRPNTRVLRLSDKLESSRMDKVFIRRMEQHNNDMRKIDVNYAFYGAKILFEYIEKRALVKWYLKHFPNGSADLSAIGKRAGFISDEYRQQELFE